MLDENKCLSRMDAPFVSLRLNLNSLLSLIGAQFFASIHPQKRKKKNLCFDAKDGYSRRSRRSKVKILAPKMDPPTFSKRAYLVESSSGGDHFYVQRNLDLTLQHTNHFKVYKLLLDEQSGEVMDRIEEKSLGGDTFFVGTNYSMSFSISTAAKFPGCQPNFIYFTPDYFEAGVFSESYRPLDVGVFNV